MKAEHIELVRNWRNSERLKPYMHFKQHITKEMQKAWFEKVNNTNNFYFLLSNEKEKIGLFFLKEIDYQNKIAEPGNFVWHEKHIESMETAIGVISIGYFAFYFLQMEKMQFHVLKKNKRALANHKVLGANIIEDLDENSVRLEVTEKNFTNGPQKRLSQVLNVMSDAITETKIILEEADFQSNLANHLIKFYSNLPENLQKNVVLVYPK